MATETVVEQIKAKVEGLSEEISYLAQLSKEVTIHAKSRENSNLAESQQLLDHAKALSDRSNSIKQIQTALFEALKTPTPDRLTKIEGIIERTLAEIETTKASHIQINETLTKEDSKPEVVVEKLAQVPAEIEVKPLPPVEISPEIKPVVVSEIEVKPLEPVDPIMSEFQKRLMETPEETYKRLNSGPAYANEEVAAATAEEVFIAIENDFRNEAGETVEPKDIQPVPPIPVIKEAVITPAEPDKEELENKEDLVETITPEEYAEQRAQALREKFKDQLEEKLPITKSIRVYDTNTGKESWLKKNEGYTIRPIGFGPRNSIRIQVFDKDNNPVKGDFITLQKNVQDGTIQNNALKSIRALELIRASYHTDPYVEEPVCKPAENDHTANDPIPTVPATTESETHDAGDYLPHCEVLRDGIQRQDKDKLKQCIRSIHSYIKANGTKRCQVIQKLFSLNEKEQDFAALVFTTVGEAPSGLPSGSPDHLMIMKVLENRENAVKRAGWKEPLNKLDLALVPMHFSMFNNHRGKFVSTSFLRASGNMDRIIDSVVDYQTATWSPPDEIKNATHYYSPPAMVPKNRRIWWARPDQNPNRTLRSVDNITVNGKPLVNKSNSPNGYHLFYAGVDGPNNYATIRRSRRTLGRCQ